MGRTLSAQPTFLEAAFHFGRQLWPKSGHRFLTLAGVDAQVSSHVGYQQSWEDK